MKNFARLLILMLFTYSVNATAGIITQSSRVIYDEGLKEYGLKVANTNAYSVLFQPWIDYGDGDPNSNLGPFVIVPPFMKLGPKETSTLRMLFDGSEVAKDRESLYWLNLYEIPLIKKDEKETQYLNMAMNTQLKIFYRPKSLPKMNTNQVLKQQKLTLVNDKGASYVTVSNPTPYHVSLLNIKVLNSSSTPLTDMVQTMDMTVLPFSEKKMQLTKALSSIDPTFKLSLQAIDDNGQIITLLK
jgi:P pilus assembly chaperone PapD